MSDFKFACTNCGHSISCDSSHQGTQITCPNCQQPLTVSQIREPPPQPVKPETTERPCGLATASLVCSLFLSLGCIPGIICGHMALGRLRRNVFLTGKGMATAGLIVSYLALFSTIGFAVVGALEVGPRHGRQLTAQEKAANTGGHGCTPSGRGAHRRSGLGTGARTSETRQLDGKFLQQELA